MKKVFVLTLSINTLNIFCALLAFAQLENDEHILQSSIPGISLGNSHILSSDTKNFPTVIRGKAPTSQQNIADLKSLGVTDVIIFKNEVKNEVQKEVQALQMAGYGTDRITHIPQAWRASSNVSLSFKDTCEKTLLALQKIMTLERAGRRVYFHCTAGEDRTGMLAGLYLIATGKNKNIQNVFATELCRRGYEAGNPKKPFANVVQHIRQNLTPVYVVLAKRILSQGLNSRLCELSVTETNAAELNQFVCR
jgi:Tyrosine phosphatase family